MLSSFSLKAKIYIILVYLTSIFLVIYTFKEHHLYANIGIVGIIFFSILAIIAESLCVLLNDISISTGFTVTLASILSFNPAAAIIIVSLGTAFRVQKRDDKIVHIFNTAIHKTLFNVSNLIISIVISTRVFELAGGKYNDVLNINKYVIPLILMVLIFLFTNYFLVFFLLHMCTNVSFSELFAGNISMGLLNIIGMTPLGIIVSVAFRQLGYIGVIIVFGPILLARYSFVMYLNIKKAYVDTVKALSLAIEAKDKYTEGHSMRVVEYACKIARKMKFSESHIENLKIASMLHDIGKIGIPEAILNKPGMLSDEEYSIIKEHPIIGANIVKDVDALKNAVDLIKYHHERYDGKGYPSGNGGDAIPLDAYIIATADAFDAMCSDRPYRKAMSRERAVEIMQQEKGKQFHPVIVDIFTEIINSERNI